MRRVIMGASLIISLLSMPALSVAQEAKSTSAEMSAGIGQWDGSTVVTTVYGRARGKADKDGTLSWFGLPYAKPPVGELRWKAPQSPEPWKNLREARAFSNFAPQFLPFLGLIGGSEDCLYLNVWRPAGLATNLPVYVYIHGGGNSTGAANLVEDYHGYGVASRSNMVFVSMNYRIGPLGWFLDDSLSHESDPESASGNFGTLDIIKALQWVRQNIEAFGGDPGNVTIAGESAGAMNVLSLLVSRQATGLFHRAIVESAYKGTVSVDEARTASSDLVASLLVKKHKAKTIDAARSLATAMPPAELAAFLRSVSAHDIIASQKAGSVGMTGWPNIIRDGVVVPQTGFDTFRTGEYPNKVPLILGSNKEENKIFQYFAKSPDWKTDLYGKLATYGALIWKAEGVDAIADSIASLPDHPPVYVYRFDWGAPDAKGKSPLPGDWGRRLGAFHSAEISFFLGTKTCLGPLFTSRLYTKANRTGRESLQTGIMAYLSSFARTGDPNTLAAGLPTWSPRGEGAYGLIMDASGDKAVFAPLMERVTKESVLQRLAAEETPEIQAAVLAKIRD